MTQERVIEPQAPTQGVQGAACIYLGLAVGGGQLALQHDHALAEAVDFHFGRRGLVPQPVPGIGLHLHLALQQPRRVLVLRRLTAMESQRKKGGAGVCDEMVDHFADRQTKS